MAEQQEFVVPQSRNFSTRKDPLELYDDRELIRRYRLDREGILFVTDLIRDIITSPTSRNRALSAEFKVILTLRYLVTGKMHLPNCDDFGPTQPTISRVITQVLHALTRSQIVTQFIHFPIVPEDTDKNKAEFRAIAGFPGVVGIIDGTHIKIIPPKDFKAEYVTKKEIHSINTQIAFDAKYRIIDLVAKWGGATHDARILRQSGLKILMESKWMPRGCHLLGDSGYPCKPWLLTPYFQPQNNVHEAYNRAHKRTRGVVKRGIGHLKRHFPILQDEIRLSPQKACQVITACAVLYNICKDRNLNLCEEEEKEELEKEEAAAAVDNNLMLQLPEADVGLAVGHPQDGLQYRNHFAQIHFQNAD